MKCGAVVVLLSLLSCGCAAPVSDCETLVSPITVSNEDILGSWLYIGGSSDLPGSRSVGRLLTSVWMNISATPQKNIVNFIQTHKIYGRCSSLTYNVTFENSAMLIEQPFYLKDVFLKTDSSGCLVAYEEVVSGTDTFTSLLLFSRTKSVSPDVLEMFKRQAECLQMPSPIMLDASYDLCPDNIPPSEGLSAFSSLLESKMAHRMARVLDALFDIFVN